MEGRAATHGLSGRPGSEPATRRSAALRRLDQSALRDCWRALWVSRIVVWVGGVGGVLALGRPRGWRGFDPASLTAPFGAFGDVLVAPAARWDSVWYLSIAHDGYVEGARTVFYPLYPLMVRIVGAPLALLGNGTGARLLAGIAISLAALGAGLYCVHRLAELELGRDRARLVVMLVALFPLAFAFSAVYTESIFLALSAGSIYAGRTGRWRLAGVLGALAAATRTTGLLLVVPLALLYAYGPRADRERPAPRPGRRRWMPAHRLAGDFWWIAVVPAGLIGYLAYLWAATGDPFAPFGQQAVWYRHFAGPLGGAWDGAVAAVAGVRQLASGSRAHVYFTPAGGDPFAVGAHNVIDFAFLVFAVVALVGIVRRLPLAYGAWALVSVAIPLSYPVGPEPLASFPRYLAVVFPLQMWLAAWAHERRAARWVLAISTLALVVETARFASWHWVT